MTGPEHYTKAEQLIEATAEFGKAHDTAFLLQVAQIHATLALAAATALATGSLPTAADLTAWEDVAGVEQK